ncbi:hypothetical protein GQ53DRAFT_770915 [Thozetella sp. PMI_491]|nr:hypothetical protein GQ53DRAFT_770915 [Thozetella sp. PMI_491]
MRPGTWYLVLAWLASQLARARLHKRTSRLGQLLDRRTSHPGSTLHERVATYGYPKVQGTDVINIPRRLGCDGDRDSRPSRPARGGSPFGGNLAFGVALATGRYHFHPTDAYEPAPPTVSVSSPVGVQCRGRGGEGSAGHEGVRIPMLRNPRNCVAKLWFHRRLRHKTYALRIPGATRRAAAPLGPSCRSPGAIQSYVPTAAALGPLPLSLRRSVRPGCLAGEHKAGAVNGSFFRGRGERPYSTELEIRGNADPAEVAGGAKASFPPKGRPSISRDEPPDLGSAS